MAKTHASVRKIEELASRTKALEIMGTLPDEEDKKNKKRLKHDRSGRPTVMTKQTIEKLKQAFKIGATRREACSYADIDPQTFYTFLNKNPDFSTLIEDWENSPVLASRANIIGAITIQKSVPDSWQYLRAKRKGEFAEQRNIAQSGVLTTDELEDAAEGIEIDETIVEK